MVEYSTVEPWQMVDENGIIFDQGSLMAYFYELVDACKARGKRYQLVTLLVLVFLAKLSGMDGPSAIADWCQARREALVERLGLHYPKMPSHHTLRRLFANLLDEEAFEEKMRAYRAGQRTGQVQPRLLAVDGKRERSTIKPGETQGEATVAVYDPEGQEVVAQAAIATGEGEIPTAQSVLGEVDLHGKIVLADALHTQCKTCQQILEGGGDYVLSIKDNQPATYQAVESLFDPAAPNRSLLAFQTASKTNKGHGRIEQRHLTALPLYPGEIDWPSLQQVFRLERTFTYLRQGLVVKIEHEVHYGLTSLPRPQADAERLLYLKRKYWQIENGLHYRRDVTFHEDATRLSHPHATRNPTTVHNTILNLFAWLGCRNAAQTRRRLNGDLRLAFSLLTSAHPRL